MTVTAYIFATVAIVVVLVLIIKFISGGYRPGKECPISGEWMSGAKRIFLSKGDRFPPTHKGGRWRMVF